MATTENKAVYLWRLFCICSLCVRRTHNDIGWWSVSSKCVVMPEWHPFRSIHAFAHLIGSNENTHFLRCLSYFKIWNRMTYILELVRNGLDYVSCVLLSIWKHRTRDNPHKCLGQIFLRQATYEELETWNRTNIFEAYVTACTILQWQRMVEHNEFMLD